uniref:Uncharacterized protein n=1 Tax=Anguilla anguilla TaxID=7936 RepID=A0A0E9TNY8_ANGAN
MVMTLNKIKPKMLSMFCIKKTVSFFVTVMSKVSNVPYYNA